MNFQTNTLLRRSNKLNIIENSKINSKYNFLDSIYLNINVWIFNEMILSLFNQFKLVIISYYDLFIIELSRIPDYFRLKKLLFEYVFVENQ